MYLLITPTGPVWPYSRQQLLSDNLNVSFRIDPSAEELEPFGVYIVAPTDPPEHDPATHRVVEVQPVLTDGVWLQAWELQELPPAPLRPDWSAFAVGLIFDETIQVWFNDLPQAIGSGLNAGLQRASEGRPDLFLRLWERLAVQVPDPVVAAVAALAQECNLPSEFVAVLNGASGS